MARSHNRPTTVISKTEAGVVVVNRGINKGTNNRAMVDINNHKVMEATVASRVVTISSSSSQCMCNRDLVEEVVEVAV